jgi:mannosyl-oligosaccharide glucosidase
MPPKNHPTATGSAKPAKSSPSMTATKRVFLFVSTLIPMIAFLSSQIPSFVTTDVICSWTDTFLSDDVVLEAQRQYVDVARSALVGSQLYNRTMHWGTYRPNVLMGIKNRAPNPLLFGIAWYDSLGRFDVKHNAVESDRLMFRWELHDGQFFGVQRVVDYENRIEVIIDFVKTPDGQGWDVQITARRSGANTPLAFVVYFAHEGGAKEFPLQSLSDTRSVPHANDDLYLHSASGGIVGVAGIIEPPLSGDAKTTTPATPLPFIATLSDTCPLMTTNASAPWSEFAFSKPKDDAWNFDIRRTPGRVTSGSKPQGHQKANNVMVFKKEFSSDFRIHVCLRELHPADATTADSKATTSPVASSAPSGLLSGCQLTRLVSYHKAAFDAKFERLFLPKSSLIVPPSQLPSQQDITKRLAYIQQHSKSLKHMASSALSNMIGSIGYWHGKYLVVPEEVDEASDKRGQFVSVSAHRGGQIDSETNSPVSLFSGAPSRAKFPRGFLWDEGFQQLLIYRWNSDISKDVIAHWLMVAMDPVTGWIPREQILGKESRGRVPREFAAQHPQHANPPSMVLAVQSLALSENKTPEDVAFLQRILPRLTAWRDWFHKTQCGSSPNCHNSLRQFPTTSSPSEVNMSAFQYRWRSRNGFHLLACGLDDYPRPVCFADGRPSHSGGATVATGNGVQQTTTHRKEKHVDLMSWMALMTQTIQKIESAIGGTNDETTKTTKAAAPFMIPWEELLVALHWDAASNRFADVTGCPASGSSNDSKGRTFRGFSGHFSPYVGYVNLFPLLSLTINNKERALAVLRLARDELNTPFGLASISAHSRSLLAQYGQQHESYWAGPIWININYLFLRALKLKYIDLLGNEAEDFYHTLRSELLENILKQYISTDKLWENYHWETGKGMGTAPFTGWTALIVLILGEQY